MTPKRPTVQDLVSQIRGDEDQRPCPLQVLTIIDPKGNEVFRRTISYDRGLRRWYEDTPEGKRQIGRKTAIDAVRDFVNRVKETEREAHVKRLPEEEG